MLRRCLFLGAVAFALLGVLGTPGQLHAQRFRGGGSPMIRPAMSGGFMPGMAGMRGMTGMTGMTGGFRAGFPGGFAPRGSRGFFPARSSQGFFAPRTSSGFFAPSVSPGFGGGMFPGPRMFMGPP